MKLKNNPEVVKQRIAICEKCPHFRKRSRTCGTPVIGNKVGSKRTCGCFMDIKTKLPFSTCPLGRWDELQVTKQDYIEIKALLDSVKYEISGEQKTLLFAMIRKYTGGNKKSSNCVPCIKSALNDMRMLVEQYES